MEDKEIVEINTEQITDYSEKGINVDTHSDEVESNESDNE